MIAESTDARNSKIPDHKWFRTLEAVKEAIAIYENNPTPGNLEQAQDWCASFVRLSREWGRR